MAITSFQKFLKQDRPKASDFIRFLQLLLQGIGLHAAEGADDDLDMFRAQIARVSEQLTEQTSSENILVSLGTVVHALEEHNRHASNFMRAHVREMQGMLAMMSSTIAFLASSSKTGVEQLQSIEKHLEKADDIDDVRLFRSKLSDCLKLVKNESVRVRDESQSRIQVLQKTMERTVKGLKTPSAPVDPATGLQTRADAEQMIAGRILDGKDALLVLFLVDRLSSLNSRFGRKVGDEVLMIVAQHLMEKLPDTSPPYRWSGPAFLALVDLSIPGHPTERQMKQIAATRLEKNIDTGARTVMLPISCSVVLQKVSREDAADAVFGSLDKFVASHGGEVR